MHSLPDDRLLTRAEPATPFPARSRRTTARPPHFASWRHARRPLVAACAALLTAGTSPAVAGQAAAEALRNEDASSAACATGYSDFTRDSGPSQTGDDVITNGGAPTAAQLGAAAKAYGRTEAEAAAMLQRVRPEMRGAFLDGKLRLAPKTPSAEAAIPLPADTPASEPSRQQIIRTMGEINQRASDENWPSARAGAARQEYARRMGTNAVTLTELKAWVADAQILPMMPVGDE